MTTEETENTGSKRDLLLALQTEEDGHKPRDAGSFRKLGDALS